MNDSSMRQHQQDHADTPVEFARLLVGAGQEDAKHVQPDRDDHQVRRPAVHVAQQLAERDVVLQVENVAERLHLRGVVVEHQQDAGEGQHDEEVERDPAHAPGVAVADGVAVDLGRMQMKEDICQNPERAAAFASHRA